MDVTSSLIGIGYFFLCLGYTTLILSHKFRRIKRFITFGYAILALGYAAGALWYLHGSPHSATESHPQTIGIAVQSRLRPSPWSKEPMLWGHGTTSRLYLTQAAAQYDVETMGAAIPGEDSGTYME